MAMRDYLTCGECDCKLIYDGYDTARDRLEALWGNPSAGTWTVSLLCPDCLGKLRTQLAEALRERDVAREYRGAGPHKRERGRKTSVSPCRSNCRKPKPNSPQQMENPHADRCAQSRMLKQLLIAEKERADRLEAAIREAPHHPECGVYAIPMSMHFASEPTNIFPCDCWKRETLEGQP